MVANLPNKYRKVLTLLLFVLVFNLIHFHHLQSFV